MKKFDALEIMNYIDPALIEKAGSYKARAAKPSAGARFARYGAMAASFILAVSIFLAVPALRESVFPSGGQREETSSTVDGTQSGDTPPVSGTENYSGSFSNATDAFRESGALGGGSTLFTREYEDVTYNIAYLRPIYRDEESVISEEELDRWENEVYLRKSPEEQNALPTLYQAVWELDIPKEEFEALNESRRERGSDMVLPDTIIDALYTSEEEVRRLLVNPLALYYEGEIYTWEELCDMTVESAVASGIPEEVIYHYTDRTVEYCIENMLISENVISRYFDRYEYGGEAEEEEIEIPETEENGITADGASAGRSTSDIHTASVRLEVENILQKPDLPNGCEVVSLAIVLRYYGYSVDPVELYDAFMPKSPYKKGDPWTTFVGDAAGRGLGCYAPCVVTTGNAYLSSVASGRSVCDVSGRGLAYYEDLVSRGVPVIMWGMKGMEADPDVCYEAWIQGKRVTWHTESHCLVMIGFTEDTYIFCDPLEGVREYTKEDVERCFDINYRQACIVK